MHMLTDSLSALWQVTAVGLVLGAGLPALFALGLRSLSLGRTATEGAEHEVSALGRLGAIVCFGIVVASALFGIAVIVFGKQIFG